MSKQYDLTKNVYEAAVERMEHIFVQFQHVYFSFSAGKDSSVMVNIAIDVAQRLNRLPIHVLLIDLEGQYQATIAHARDVLGRPEVVPYWICLPMNLRNAVSVFQPHWLCWDPDQQDKWIRPLPDAPGVISDPNYFPWFRIGMEFEEFIIEFGKNFAPGKPTACGVAIRSDESLNRLRTIMSETKTRYDPDWPWTTKVEENLYNFYPIYDWRTEDIWTAVGQFGWDYNHIYDGMYQAGKSIHESRICQPYGDDQRRGLDLFRKLEPQTWARVVDRVAGANYGNIYCGSSLVGHRKVVLPEGHTWQSYTEFLLETLPRYEAEWYRAKFQIFFRWWADHGVPEIPDEADGHLEAMKKVPSWRRLAKVLIKNDRLCKGLSFAQTKGQYAKYLQLKELYGE